MPTLLVLDASGRERGRVAGMIEAEDLAERLNRISEGVARSLEGGDHP